MFWNKIKAAFCLGFLISFVTSDIEECSRQHSDTGGGHFTISGSDEEIRAPWLVAIGISRPNKEFTLFCSGSLLSKKFILSAAHCFLHPALQPTHVRVGANNIDSVFAEQRDILDVKIHPDYDSVSTAYYFDVAIVTVDEEFKFSSRISPICLPVASSIHPGDGVGISVQGWGGGGCYRREGKEVSQVNVNIRSKVYKPYESYR